MIESGALTWMNWQAHRENATLSEGYEFILYSDSLISGLGESQPIGPYRFINALSGILHDAPHPSIVVEVDLHSGEFPEIAPPPLRPALGSKTWIGLSVDEEIAALLSLILGARLRSSGPTRKWEAEFPQGRPWFFDYQVPVLADARSQKRQRMFPDLPDASINAEPIVKLLPSFSSLTASAAVAVTRSAREYANALWIAESEPELSWLQLVSAIEVAANQRNVTVSDPLADLESAFPTLATQLRQSDGNILNLVAEQLAGLTRSRQKFLGFVDQFLPDPPTPHPSWTPGLDWSDKRDMRKRVDTIYKHRSKRLHEAIPFPSPLVSPGPLEDPTDVPVGEGSASAFSSWSKDDLPLTLWAFAHLTRGALLNWWRSLEQVSDSSAQQS